MRNHKYLNITVGTLCRLHSDKTQLGVLWLKFNFIEGGGLTLLQRVLSLKKEVCVCPAWLSLYRPHVGGGVKDGCAIGGREG